MYSTESFGKACIQQKKLLYQYKGEGGFPPLAMVDEQGRLMFLHYLLNESEESLIFKVLKAQVKTQTKNDWINLLKSDLKYLDIYLSIDDIQALSKQQFKTFLHVIIQEKALKYLNNLKNNHSKVSHIQHDDDESSCFFLNVTQEFSPMLTFFVGLAILSKIQCLVDEYFSTNSTNSIGLHQTLI